MIRLAALTLCLAACAPVVDAYSSAPGHSSVWDRLDSLGSVKSAPPASDPVRDRMRYEQMRNQDLILQHGAGGCTPDFVTGGCL